MRLDQATATDLHAVEALLTDAGLPLDGATDAFRTGVVAVEGDVIVGAAAIEPYGESVLLRSVVVAPEHRGQGVGHSLVVAAEGIARARGARRAYLLTETASDWFTRLGYERIGRDDVDPAVAASAEFTTACADTAIVMSRSFVGD